MTNAFYFAVTFLFIFGWKVTELLDLILLVSLALCFWVFVVSRQNVRDWERSVSITLLILVVYCAAVSLVFGAADQQMFMRSLRALINYLGAAALVYAYHITFGVAAIRILVLHIFLALVAHSFLIVAMYLSAELRLAIYALIRTMDYVNPTTPIMLGLRICGLTYGLATTSVLQLMALLLLPVVLAHWGTTRTRVFMLISTAIPVAFSILLTGRTGLAFAVILLPLLWWLIRRLDHRSGLPMRRRVAAIVFLLLAAVGFQWLLGQMPERFAYSLKTAKEVVELFVEGRSETTDVLDDMYFLPEDATTLIWGSSNFGRGELKTIESDVGFVLMIFAGGLIATLLTMMPYVLAITLAGQCYRANLEPRLAAATAICFLSGVMLHFKEVALLTRNHWSVLALLIICCAMEWRRATRRAGRAGEVANFGLGSFSRG